MDLSPRGWNNTSITILKGVLTKKRKKKYTLQKRSLVGLNNILFSFEAIIRGTIQQKLKVLVVMMPNYVGNQMFILLEWFDVQHRPYGHFIR